MTNQDYWKIEEFKKGDMKSPLLEETSFVIPFPKYREKYLMENWPQIRSFLSSNYSIDAEINLIEGSMTVRTTPDTWDPYIIIKARDFIHLLSRSVPFEEAKKVMQDGIICEIIRLKPLVRNKEKFIKRRERLIGPNGNTLRAIEILTETKIFVKGKTVAVIGSYDRNGIDWVRRIVLECFRNVHPIYLIKELMIRKELAKDPELKDKDWDRFLPQFKKRNVKRKKIKKKKKSGVYNPFPNEPTPRKIDLAIESGEYFMSEKEKEFVKKEKIREKQEAHRKVREEKRMEMFVPPEERPLAKKEDDSPRVEEVVESVKEKMKGKKKEDEGVKVKRTGGRKDVSEFISKGRKET